MKQPSTADLLKILKYEEMIHFICSHRLPHDFEERWEKYRHKTLEELRDARHLKALKFGMQMRDMTKSCRKWRLEAVVMLVCRQECRLCGNVYNKPCDLMLKSVHPYYGSHIYPFDKDSDYSDYSDLRLEVYTRQEKLRSCQRCTT